MSSSMPRCLVPRFDYRLAPSVPINRYQWDEMVITAAANGWTPFPIPDRSYVSRPFTVHGSSKPDHRFTSLQSSFLYRCGFVTSPLLPQGTVLPYGSYATELLASVVRSLLYLFSWFMFPMPLTSSGPRLGVVVFAALPTSSSTATFEKFFIPTEPSHSSLLFHFPGVSSSAESSIYMQGTVLQYYLTDEQLPTS
jgi:hypothetical protein